MLQTDSAWTPEVPTECKALGCHAELAVVPAAVTPEVPAGSDRDIDQGPLTGSNELY